MLTRETRLQTAAKPASVTQALLFTVLSQEMGIWKNTTQFAVCYLVHQQLRMEIGVLQGLAPWTGCLGAWCPSESLGGCPVDECTATVGQ